MVDMTHLHIIFVAITLVVNFYMLFYVYQIRNKNKDCTCENTTPHTIIVWYLITTVIFMCGFVVLYFSKRTLFHRLVPLYMLIALPITLCYVAVTIYYIRQLHKSNCSCATSPDKIALQAVTITSGILASIEALVILGIIILGYVFHAKKK